MRIVLAASPAVATPAAADPSSYGRMMDFGYGYGPAMMFGPVLWLIVLGLVVAGVIWLVRRTDGATPGGKSDARAILDTRFAKGEIDVEDYEARKKLLSD